ncbi:AAA family ATPase [Pseudoalteromonas sp. TB51]|uniref:AAA family ATPase n=1 Tax=Pseudoalteromonas sp. TB51 TaxID=1055803 RepID=UPI0004124E8E|nr:AAA family ATPase [Pseudoalteromonas sp. TB51]|tara:strand:+ start:3562 stop:5037 length:1476 start_codon:yes stop_codon:yes gene_type:complete
MQILETQSVAVKAEYIPHNITAYNNNPLIEAIRPAKSLEAFTQAILVNHDVDASVTQMNDFDRELMIELIPLTFVPSPKTFKIYRHIVKAIMVGYLHRRPFTIDYNIMQSEVGKGKDYEMPNAINLSTCISHIGISGGGKTKTIDKCLSLLPQVIEHNEYKGNLFRKEQVVYVKFEAPATKTKKGFILNFFFAIDQLLGSSHYELWKGSKANNSAFVIEAKKVAMKYNIGIVFIDEIQRCVYDSNDAKDENRSTLNFIDAFFNSIGIPMIVAGTYASWPLFQTTMSTSRRISSGISERCDGIETTVYDPVTKKHIANPFWNYYVQCYYKPHLLRNPFTFTDEITSALNFYSCGIPALFIRLIKLCYEEAIYSGLETISVDLIRDVYADQFYLLADALHALREGEVSTFEDLIKPHIKLLNPAKAGEDMSTADVVEKYCIDSDVPNPPGMNDEGVVIDMPAAKSTLIPADDFRNLSGLSRQEIAAKLGEVKS